MTVLDYIILQFFVSLIVLFLSTRMPKTLLLIFLSASLLFVYSLLANEPIWHYEVLKFDWIMTLIKWIIVVICAAGIVLFSSIRQYISPTTSIFVIFILAFNMAWTIVFAPLSSISVIIRDLLCLLLIFSLTIRSIKYWRQYKTLAIHVDNLIVFYPISTLWLLVYTGWNMSFTLMWMGSHIIIQIITFWLGIGYFMLNKRLPKQYRNPKSLFIFSRSITLASYALVSHICGFFLLFRQIKWPTPLPPSMTLTVILTVLLSLAFVDCIKAIYCDVQ